MTFTDDISKWFSMNTVREQQNAADLRERDELLRAFPALERELENNHLERLSNGALICGATLLAVAVAYLIGRALLAAWQGGTAIR